MNNRDYKKIIDFIKNQKTCDIDIMNYIDIQELKDYDIDEVSNFINNMIVNKNGCDVEIIYYDSAMEYLQENDPSLNESLELAKEFWFNLDSINSEILASLLASEYNRDDFNDFIIELETFIKNTDNLKTK